MYLIFHGSHTRLKQCAKFCLSKIQQRCGAVSAVFAVFCHFIKFIRKQNNEIFPCLPKIFFVLIFWHGWRSAALIFFLSRNYHLSERLLAHMQSKYGLIWYPWGFTKLIIIWRGLGFECQLRTIHMFNFYSGFGVHMKDKTWTFQILQIHPLTQKKN